MAVPAPSVKDPAAAASVTHRGSIFVEAPTQAVKINSRMFKNFDAATRATFMKESTTKKGPVVELPAALMEPSSADRITKKYQAANRTSTFDIDVRISLFDFLCYMTPNL